MESSTTPLRDEKLTRRPVVDPLLLALKSRRVLIALVTLIVGVLTMLVPALETVRSELLTLLIALALALIGGYSIEDAVRAGRESATGSSDALSELIKNALNEWIDEFATRPQVIKNILEGQSSDNRET